MGIAGACEHSVASGGGREDEEEGKGMGRHRRSDAGRATTGRTTGVTETYNSYTGNGGPSYGDTSYTGYTGYTGHTGYPAHTGHGGRPTPRESFAGGRGPLGIAPYLHPEAYADTSARGSAYPYATHDDSGYDYARAADTAAFSTVGFNPDEFTLDGFGPEGFRPDEHDVRPRGHRRKKKAATPVRTGLLGVSAAVAIGTAAVAAGVMPGLNGYGFGGSTGIAGSDSVQAAGSPGNTAAEQGGTSGSAQSGTQGGTAASGQGGASSTSPVTHRPAPPAPPVSSAPSAPASAGTPSQKQQTAPHTKKPKPATPPGKARKTPPKTSAPVGMAAQTAAEAEVLKLVNQERAKVGCTPLAADHSLTKLAEALSKDMAARDFFDHTDPDGATPWDRAAKAGILGLGGENIARGQTDAAAVVAAWMNSPGHRANILNCDFKTLGVGVHFGSGGPWWTQDFGY
jgi:uncharacterized protein YkwD